MRASSQCDPPPEKWLPVAGFEGYYEVSNQGRVRSLTRIVKAGGERTRISYSRILRQTPNAGGRLTVKLSVLGTTRTRLVHQMALEAFHGLRPQGMLACHNNGKHLDNRVANLRWDTPAENMRDKRRHGTNHNLNKTHCPRDHPLRRPNLVAYRALQGCRVCLACARARAKEQRSTDPDFDFAATADAYYAVIADLRIAA